MFVSSKIKLINDLLLWKSAIDDYMEGHDNDENIG